MKVKTLDEYRQEMLNKTFGWLTVLDVFRDEETRDRLVKCQCKCGNITIKEMRKVYNGHTTSCGCYSSSKEKSSKLKRSWANDPERCKSQSDKLKQHYIDHPETAELIGQKVSQFYDENPDKALDRGKRYSEWAASNKERLSEIGKAHSKFYKDNPEVGIEAGKKLSQFYKDNPDALKARVAKRTETLQNNPDIQKAITEKCREWSKNNPDKVQEIAIKNSSIYKNLRKLTDYSELIECVHQDQIDDLLNGNITSQEMIKTRCPKCGDYDEHSLHNLFLLKSGKLKSDSLPLCHKCYSNNTSSKYEQEIADYISTIYHGEVIRNDREIIKPYELDLYYPEKKIAIEFNGDYWHSTQCGKAKDYHLNKYKLCKESGIRLISVFEHDYKFKHDKVLQLLNDTFTEHKKIYARNCEIRQINNNEKSTFINKYHFDGDSKYSTISYGLYYDDELISCMTFGKLRGQNSLRDNPNYYELVRFVTKSRVTVIGGASKLLKHFIKDYNPEYILCYSDNDFFNGETYNKLGFKLKSLGENSIDYIWSNGINYRTRYQTMPYKLLKQYQEYNNIEINGSKEDYIMEDLGYNKIYRCGNSIWEYSHGQSNNSKGSF